MSAAPLYFEETRPVALASGVLWDLLSDTEHLNRMIGLPPVRYGTPNGVSDVSRPASARLGPFPLAWREMPFEWVQPERHRVRRVFTGGPFAEGTGGISLAPDPSGHGDRTLLTVSGSFTPRGVLGRVLAPLVARKAIGDVFRYVEKARVLRASSPASDGIPRPAPAALRVNRPRLDAALERLDHDVSLAVAVRLAAHLATGSDEEVLGMKPFALAERWRLDRRETLRAFLHGTRAGLVEMEWELMCPNCRVPTAGQGSLSGLRSSYHCDFCGVDYDTDLDQATELRFHVHPAVRRAERAVYCLGGPVRTPHILAQQYLAPGETRAFSLPVPDDAAGDLRLRVLRRNHVHLFSGPPLAGTGPLRFAYDGAGWTAPEGSLPPGRIDVELENRSGAPALVVLERLAWDDLAVSAALVTTMDEFRAHFGSEVLAPGREIAVRRVALLFTDVRASTALYEGIGDAPAYGRVRRHFDYLGARVAEHRGAVVKTIGDAVMAAFRDPADAMAAALAIQAGLAAFNAEHGFDPPLALRVGVHCGPAIAVNANGVLDYFGRTVNVASRLEAESRGGDVVCPEAFLDEPGVGAVLDRFAVRRRAFTAQLKGIAEAAALARLDWA